MPVKALAFSEFTSKTFAFPCFLILFNHFIFAAKVFDFVNTKEILANLLNTTKLKRIWISPNNDSGSTIIKSEFNKQRTQNDYIFDNLSRSDYLSLLCNAEFILGNSSSGILEAPTFKTPCINIGYRQNGRVRAINVIDVSTPTKTNLITAFKKINSSNFRKNLAKVTNPYGKGDSSKKIINILLKTKIDDNLLFKKLTY